MMIKHKIAIFVSLFFFQASAQISNSLTLSFIENNFQDNVSDISPKNIKTGLVSSYQKNSFNSFVTNGVYFNSPIYQQQIGMGIQFAQSESKTQIEKSIAVGGNYNLLVARDTLSFGLGIGFNQQSLTLSDLFVEDESDVLLAESGNSSYNSQFNLGLTFSPKDYFFSISIKNVKELIFSSTNQNTHVSLWGNRVFSIGNSMKLKPGLRVEKYNNRTIISTSFIEQEFRRIGSITLAYLTTQTVSFQGTLLVNRYFKVFDPFLLGYSYAFNLSNHTFYQPYTHQIFINYSFRKTPSLEKINKMSHSNNQVY